MKTIAIGDIHGRDSWKEIIQQNFDRCVFVGDYFDTRDKITNVEQIKNFLELIEFKKNNPDKVVLLIGNHDYHYLPYVTEKYSGFVSHQKPERGRLLIENRDLLQMCYVQDKFLFAHAGVTKTWCKNNELDLTDIEKSINELFYHKPRAFAFTEGRNYDPYGNDVDQTPIWVRPKSLLADMIDGYTQVVGHTQVNSIVTDHKIILVDALASGEYLIINDSSLDVGKIFIN